MSIIFASAFLAFSIALPFGPVSFMCMQRSIVAGARRGLVCGAGASTAHGLFASLALIATGTMASVLTGWQPLIQVFSGAALIAIGCKLLLKLVTTTKGSVAVPGFLADYGAGLMTALSNPVTVVSYLAIASSGSMIGRAGVTEFVATVAGVVLGSITWYAIVSGSAHALRGRLPPLALRMLNIIGGVVLIGMGVRLAVFPELPSLVPAV
ncbi:Threonine/homoserine/homoserine lactone efflux protein [Rhizobium sp. NFR07]|nr:Threonine/homoserine/homoserine lactone efflux protein [Rhizobium sp. NFR07]